MFMSCASAVALACSLLGPASSCSCWVQHWHSVLLVAVVVAHVVFCMLRSMSVSTGCLKSVMWKGPTFSPQANVNYMQLHVGQECCARHALLCAHGLAAAVSACCCRCLSKQITNSEVCQCRGGPISGSYAFLFSSPPNSAKAVGAASVANLHADACKLH